MSSLRRRVLAATGLLIGLQVAGTCLGFASWRAVHQAGVREQRLSEERDAVLELAAAARESYVHQAHTFIEGGPGHLEHLTHTAAILDQRLAAVEQMALPPGADLGAVHESIAASNAWFGLEVVPLAEAGGLDRDTAVRLHGIAEQRSADTERAISSVLGAISTAQSSEMVAISRLTSQAWIGVGLLTLGGIGLGGVIAARLARAILGPIGALETASRAIATGSSARAPEEGDDELVEVGRAFNAMVEQVRAAEHRRIQVERLAALGEMSGAVAHELMNPLAVILGHEALRAPELAPIRAEAEHARRIVTGLLGFARPGEEPEEDVDLRHAATQAAARIATTADLRDVAVRAVEGSPVAFVASPSAVRQVLDNLLRNAVEASSPGSAVEIDVREGPVVEVRDRGPGIPHTVRARLYQPFVTGKPNGTGLGLAVCQRIVRAQGGSLTHRDREGGGTVAVWEVGRA
jgi:signal transduction histidine kinase